LLERLIGKVKSVSRQMVLDVWSNENCCRW